MYSYAFPCKRLLRRRAVAGAKKRCQKSERKKCDYDQIFRFVFVHIVIFAILQKIILHKNANRTKTMCEVKYDKH